VAKNVRKVLKSTYGNSVKFSVKASGSSLGVSWVDGPTSFEVDKLLSCFKAGSFNSMEDIYESNISPFNEVFGGVDYLTTYRENGVEAVNRQINRLWEMMPSDLLGVDKPDAASIHNSEIIPTTGDHIGEVVRRLANRFNCLSNTYYDNGYADFYLKMAMER